MKKFYLALVGILSLLAVSEAATFKRPLTAKLTGGIGYLEWADTATLAAADSLMFLADTTTARMWMVDQTPLLYRNYSATPGGSPWNLYPGMKFPEKFCTRVYGVGNGGTSTVSMVWGYSTTKAFTAGSLQNDITVSTMSITTAGVVANLSSNVDPGRYFRVIMIPATNGVSIRRITIFACDD